MRNFAIQVHKFKTVLIIFTGIMLLWQTVLAQTFRPVVRGKRGVVAAGHPLTAEAGLRLLQQGGNAVDAGCAAILTASVIEFSHFSFGGEVPILIKAGGGKPVVISGQGIAPQLATRDFFINLKGSDGDLVYKGSPEYVSIRGGGAKEGPIPSSGILPATVPGVLDAVVLALDRYGTKSLSEVIQPAIEAAEGFPIDETRVQYINNTRPIFEKWPSTNRVFLPGGNVPEVGGIFSQPDLSRTLRSIADAEREAMSRGRHEALMAARNYFYNGPVARRISEFSETNGGLLRSADFASYHAEVEEPATTVYRGLQVYKPGFWTGGPAMLETLNILELFDLAPMKHNSAEYIHTLVEAMKLGFADRDRFYGDPEFARVPAQELLSKEYAQIRKALIDVNRASLEQRPGNVGESKTFLSVESGGIPTSTPDTTCVNVIDKDGNMFSATPSGAWLPAVVAGDTGVLLGQRLQAFLLQEGHPNVLEPGKRPRITLVPTIVLKDEQPFLALSTPGGDTQDQTLLQVFLNIVEFGMNVQEAVEAPRFQTLHLISTFDDHRFNPGALNVEDRIGKEVQDALIAKGHKLDLHTAWGNPSAPTVIRFRPDTGVIEAGADPRRGRYALAW